MSLVDLDDDQKRILDDIQSLSRRHDGLKGMLAARGEYQVDKPYRIPEVGEIGVWDAPTSTSLSRKVLRDLLVAEGTAWKWKGKSIIYEVHGISKARSIITNAPKQEIILAPHTKFRVLDRSQNVKYFGESGKMMVDELVVVEIIE